MLSLLKKITFREGKLDDILAEGTARAAEVLGESAEKYAMQVKVLEIAAHDPRAYSLPVGMSTWMNSMTSENGFFNLQPMISSRRGISGKDYNFPDRFLKEKRAAGPAGENLLDIETMLEEYYTVRGWDTNGIPTKDRLKILNLTECINGGSQ